MRKSGVSAGERRKGRDCRRGDQTGSPRIERPHRWEKRKTTLTLVEQELIDVPRRAPLLRCLVPVDLLLLEPPLRERVHARPKDDLGRHVHELEPASLCLPWLSVVAVDDEDLEVGVVDAAVEVCFGPGGELLVGRGERGGDVVGEQVRVGVDVVQLDHVLVADDPPAARLGELLGREDLPVVVGVVERVAGHLLACAVERRGRKGSARLQRTSWRG